jgi:hypothetical protein
MREKALLERWVQFVCMCEAILELIFLGAFFLQLIQQQGFLNSVIWITVGTRTKL